MISSVIPLPLSSANASPASPEKHASGLPGTLEDYFTPYRNNIIGIDQKIKTHYGKNIPLFYADWTASGRNYRPIEDRIQQEIMPWMANTHTETSTAGTVMSHAYRTARSIIKKHVNARPNDVLITCGSGTTEGINKLQRIMGLKIHPHLQSKLRLKSASRPVVFVTHMEHHSNHISWLETTADVVIIRPTADGLVDLDHLQQLLYEYRSRPQKIAAITACSNVTGIGVPYQDIARLMHQAQGYCLVDFAAAAPYLNIDMHPANEDERLDAIYFSPHKFLGGPGSAGVLVFNKMLGQSPVPDHPGGGTVNFTSPWEERMYVEDIEEREDGGTPAILQTIKAALSAQLKDAMGVKNIQKREQEQLALLWPRLARINHLCLLASEHSQRLGIIAFTIKDLSYTTGVRMLNDCFGIQTRGGCSCAGTYGHYLLNISREKSTEISKAIRTGYLKARPGWIRLSLHPTMTNREIIYLADCIEALADHHQDWIQDYQLNPLTGTLRHRFTDTEAPLRRQINACFTNPFT